MGIEEGQSKNSILPPRFLCVDRYRVYQVVGCNSNYTGIDCYWMTHFTDEGFRRIIFSDDCLVLSLCCMQGGTCRLFGLPREITSSIGFKPRYRYAPAFLALPFIDQEPVCFDHNRPCSRNKRGEKADN